MFEWTIPLRDPVEIWLPLHREIICRGLSDFSFSLLYYILSVECFRPVLCFHLFHLCVWHSLFFTQNHVFSLLQVQSYMLSHLLQSCSVTAFTYSSWIENVPCLNLYLSHSHSVVFCLLPNSMPVSFCLFSWVKMSFCLQVLINVWPAGPDNKYSLCYKNYHPSDWP